MPETEFERYQRELEVINSLPNREELLGHILDLQWQSPRDRAWPTESGNEPEPEEGWDPSGTHHLATVHLVHSKLKAGGTIPCDVAGLEALAVDRYRKRKACVSQIAQMLGVSRDEAKQILIRRGVTERPLI